MVRETRTDPHFPSRKPTSSGQAISALRRLLIEKNMEEFTNPRDPTAINARRAFLKYDKNRSVMGFCVCVCAKQFSLQLNLISIFPHAGLLVYRWMS